MKRQLLLDDSGFHIRVNQLRLSTVFQTIYNTSNGQPYGYEAFLRASDSKGRSSAPYSLFNGSSFSKMELIELDLTSAFLHTINFYCHQHESNGKLCINFNPNTLNYITTHRNVEGVLLALINKYKTSSGGFDHRDIVVEITPSDGHEQRLLKQHLRCLKDLGVGVAIDDFSISAATEQRVIDLVPNIVKLDRCLLQRHHNGDSQPLDSTIKLAKKHNFITVLEGVECLGDLMLAQAKGIELVQGVYLNQPNSELSQHPFDVDLLLATDAKIVGL